MDATALVTEDKQCIGQGENRAEQRNRTDQGRHDRAEAEDPAESGATAIGPYDPDPDPLLADRLATSEVLRTTIATRGLGLPADKARPERLPDSLLG